MPQPVVFISYSHKDEKEKEALLAHLGSLQRIGLIKAWSDDLIDAGADWEQEVNNAIAQAKVAVLLVTANFLNSEFITTKEIPPLLDRQAKRTLKIIPVIAKACPWQKIDWLRKIQVLPENGRPIWGGNENNVDHDLAIIAQTVARIVNQDVSNRGEVDDSTEVESYQQQEKGETSFNFSDLRQRINRQFDDAELDAFILDHFPEIYDKFSRGMRKDEKITLLIDHYRRNPGRYYDELAQELGPIPRGVPFPLPQVGEWAQQHPFISTATAIFALLTLIVVLQLPVFIDAVNNLRQPGNLLSLVAPLPTATPTLTSTPTPTPSATPRPTMPNTGFNIAVARFVADNSTSPVPSEISQDLSDWIFKGIYDQANLSPDLNATVWGPDMVGTIEGISRDSRDLNAKNFAKTSKANLVIYGVITRSNEIYYVQPEFYVAWHGFEYGIEIVGPDRLGKPVTFTLRSNDTNFLQRIPNELKARREVLQHVAFGLGHYDVHNYKKAWAEFIDASIVDQGQAGDVIHLLLGATNLRIYDVSKAEPDQRALALNQAINDFTKAKEINPNYGRSYLGLGAAALQQATILNTDGTDIDYVDPVKLLEANDLYLKGLEAGDQPTTAYIPVKAAYGLGQIQLVGYEFGLPDWSSEEARRLFNQVITTGDLEKAPELTWFVGDAQALLCRLDGLGEDWETMSARCHEAIETLSVLAGDDPDVQIMMAHYWVWISCAERKLGDLDEARDAYDEAIKLGQGYVTQAELEAWQAERDNLKEGGSCRE